MLTSSGGGGKICQNLADVICERSLSVLALSDPLLDSLLNKDWPGRGGLSRAHLVLYSNIYK